MNVLTALQFHGQGTSASQVLSIAKFLAHPARRLQAQADILRNIAMKLSVLTGESLHKQRKPFISKRKRRHGSANDNRRTSRNEGHRHDNSHRRNDSHPVNDNKQDTPVRFGVGFAA